MTIQMEDNQLSFDRTTWVVQNQMKINTMEILEKYKITPKHKARIHVPLCRMVPMFIVRPTLEINILKMEHAFHMGYGEEYKVFYLSPTNWKGDTRKNVIHFDIFLQILCN
jgi:hypothetical protein